jgi:hypothetical protein
MRQVLNRSSKLHPPWDGPFVVLDTTDHDVYQLGTANGYILPNLTNALRLRRLSAAEAEKYREDFWYASKRLRLYDRLVKEQTELNEVQKDLAKATTEALNRQKQGLPAPLDKHEELSAKRKEIIATQRQIRDLDIHDSGDAQNAPDSTAPAATSVVTAPITAPITAPSTASSTGPKAAPSFLPSTSSFTTTTSAGPPKTAFDSTRRSTRQREIPKRFGD